MSMICFAVAAVLFFLLGLHIVEPSGKYNLDQIGLGFIALGLLLGGVNFPSLNVVRRG